MKKNTIKPTSNLDPKEYAQFLEHIKTDILQSQLRASLSINKELILLYWRIGNILSAKIESEGWGTKVVEKLAQDLNNAFPATAGFSRTNIYRMMAFYKAYVNCPTTMGQIEKSPLSALPWGHNITVLEKLQDNTQRLWYAQEAIKNGWSRSTLATWIDSGLYDRQGKSITNFKKTLPKRGSDLAQQTTKDPYIFDFLAIHKDATELEIEIGLVAHIQKFLIELGQGFAFVGRQYHLEIGGQDFYIDLLFYHLQLRCFIVVELKNTEFIPEYAGKLNFYLSVVDDKLRAIGDQPTIGLLLCKSKNNFLAEYALRDINKPIGISNYTTKLVESLPKELKGKLPTIKEIEAELGKIKSVKKPAKIVNKRAAKTAKKRLTKKA